MFFKRLCFNFLLLTTFNVHSQTKFDTAFLKYLSQNNFRIEHYNYLHKLDLQNDSISYFKSKYYFQYCNDSLLIKHVSSSEKLFIEDEALLLHYSTAFLNPLKHNTISWFESGIFHDYQLSSELNVLSGIYEQSKIPELKYMDSLPIVLREDFKKHYTAYKKKEWISGSLSAMVPGLGLWYLNKPRSFLTSLLLVAGFGLQTLESYKKLGLRHPLTIINGAFFIGFYTVNIGGSILEVKKNKIERRNQFLIHASNYYSATYNTFLY